VFVSPRIPWAVVLRAACDLRGWGGVDTRCCCSAPGARTRTSLAVPAVPDPCHHPAAAAPARHSRAAGGRCRKRRRRSAARAPKRVPKALLPVLRTTQRQATNGSSSRLSPCSTPACPGVQTSRRPRRCRRCGYCSASRQRRTPSMPRCVVWCGGWGGVGAGARGWQHELSCDACAQSPPPNPRIRCRPLPTNTRAPSPPPPPPHTPRCPRRPRGCASCGR
jgi:hypothetical protein